MGWYLPTDHGQVNIIPLNSGANAYYDGTINTGHLLCIGKLTEIWSYTIAGGLLMSCDGARNITWHMDGETDYTHDFPNSAYGDYVCLGCVSDMYVTQIRLIFVNQYHGYTTSSGKQHYVWVGVNGIADYGTPQTLDDFLASLTDPNYIYYYINLYQDGAGGGRVRWYQHQFQNGENYIPWFGNKGQTYTFPTSFLTYALRAVREEVPSDDPYSPGGTSDPGAGEATFDFSSEPVDFQAAPTIGAYDTGMVSLYVPSAANLQALASYLWAGAWDINNFRKLVADPMEAIIGLSILPVTDTEIGTTTATLMVGNISTGLSMPRAEKQYVVVDCGSINILPKWGAYVDFSPYSKLQLFLPYIGYVDISPDDCMNSTIAVKYTVDILSGSCVAQVKCDDHVLYEFSGTCSCQCPVTAGQYQNIVMGALRGVGAVAAIAGGFSTGNVGAAMSGIGEAISTVQDSVKPDVSRSGGFGGSSGLMGHQVPYLVLTIPRLCIPGAQNVMIGYPSFITANLGDLTGYCAVETIHITGIPGASMDDLLEIESLLKGGVYL